MDLAWDYVPEAFCLRLFGVYHAGIAFMDDDYRLDRWLGVSLLEIGYDTFQEAVSSSD